MRGYIPVLLVTVLLHANKASAQAVRSPYDVDVPRGDLAAGVGVTALYSNQDPEGGIVLSAARNFAEWFGVASEGTFYFFPTSSTAAGRSTAGAAHHMLALVAGPRVATAFIRDDISTRPSDFRVFAQLLWGIQANEVSSSGTLLQPGTGVDVNTASGWMWRLQYDYRIASNAPRNLSGHRIGVSLVLPLGSRD